MKYLLLTILFISCYTAKKAAKDIEKAYAKHPKVVAEKAQKLFPVKSDSAELIKWRQDVDSIILVYDRIISDTVQDVKERERIVERIKYKIKTMPPIYRLDSALIYQLTSRVNEAEKQMNKFKGRADIYFKIIACIIAAGLLLLLGYYIKR